ncbi:hypothetical protein CJ195_16145 [Bacillus sp. UMB0899]|nr:hypothetical protein CJ195_16145 [Bacillus sp. UMB0899]
MSKQECPPSTPRWVKFFLIIAFVIVIVFVILKILGIGGEHGPSRHLGYYIPLVEQVVLLS